MDDKTLQRKLNQMVKLGNELDAEAKRRYGPDALLFHEGDGGLLIMEKLTKNGSQNDNVRFSAIGFVRWGAGAF
jgi:hypothetical protein